MAPFQGMGASLCLFPLNFFLPRGARAMWGFPDPRTSWCPQRHSLKFPQRIHLHQKPRTLRRAGSSCLQPGSLLICPTLSRQWKGLQALSKSPLGGGPREYLFLLPQCLGLLLLQSGTIHTLEPQRNATVLWNTVFKNRARGRDHLCSTFPNFRVTDSRRHQG